MSLIIVIFVSALVGLFALLSLLPMFSDGPDTDSLVHLHE